MNVIIQQYNHLSLLNNVELEARVCFSGTKNNNLSNINVFMFNNILNELKETHPDYVNYNQTVYCYDDDKRLIKTQNDSLYQKKTRMIVQTIDTCSKYLKIKWSLNIEEEIPEFPDVNRQYTREKIVHIFDILPNWQLYCIEAKAKFNTYEIEIERVGTEPITENDVHQIQFYIEKLFANRYENQVASQFNSMMNPEKFTSHYILWHVVKPINLKYHMWKSMKNYNFHLKYDGERFLAFVLQNSIYIINETNVKRIFNKCHIPDKTIIDVEYVKESKTYYMFDILFYAGNDVRNKPFTERYSILETVSKKTPHQFKLSKSYSSFKELNKFVFPLAKGIDGIIFVPRNEIYKNKCTYKYKPFDLLTTDLLVKDNKLYMECNTGLVLFEGDANHKYNPNTFFICDFEYKDGDVIEFKYDKGQSKFVALKKRYDKIKPNYINVVLDIWYDIFNEIDMKSFIQNISI